MSGSLLATFSLRYVARDPGLLVEEARARLSMELGYEQQEGCQARIAPQWRARPDIHLSHLPRVHGNTTTRFAEDSVLVIPHTHEQQPVLAGTHGSAHKASTGLRLQEAAVQRATSRLPAALRKLR